MCTVPLPSLLGAWHSSIYLSSTQLISVKPTTSGAFPLAHKGEGLTDVKTTSALGLGSLSWLGSVASTVGIKRGIQKK